MIETAATSTVPAALTGRRLTRQVGRQGAMLFSGFALAQICSFARNAIVGYWLSKGDFGVAATITIALQMLETLSDLGADRLLVQAVDGDDPRLMATAHATLLLRGLLTAAILFLSAGLAVQFFAIPNAESAFQLAALVPLIKALMHLDSRRQQRGLRNRNYLLIEVVPQFLALLATVPLLYLTGDYRAVVWIAILQAALSVITSHGLSKRQYALGLEPEFVKRLIAFGWPIWLSAFPLVIVYQGDRIIVGRLLGIEALASYSAAFMVAMVPGLIAAKVGHALMLPLLSARRDDPGAFFQRYLTMFEGVSIAAAGYLVAFVIAGGTLLPLAFGPQYHDLGPILGWLAAMWSLRMIQAVPGMALMAQGDTRPLLTAGIIRAAALGPALVAVHLGLGLAGVAAAGMLGELASVVCVARRAAKGAPGLAAKTLLRVLYPLIAGVAAAGATMFLPAGVNGWMAVPFGFVLAVCAVLAGFAAMPNVRAFIDSVMTPRRTTAAATAQSDSATAAPEPAHAATRF
jgi:O-antigen/teichoic acid export membrane protein